jgi:aminoglycoside 6'-N-acetyltransferase
VVAVPARVIEFAPMTADDLVRFHEWLQRPHVKRWWRDRETYEDVVEHYLPAIEGREPSDHYLIVLEDRPIGVIQTYLVSDYPEWDAIVEAGEGVAGVDLAIGEADLIGRGLGSQVLSQFARDIVFARSETLACVATVEEGNRRSWRAFEKAGFRHVRDVEEDGLPHRLMRLDRG